VVYLLAPPLPREHTSDAYAAAALRSAQWDGTPVDAVLAYCMAAPLAQDTAARTGAPLVLLFDGEPSTPQDIGDQFRQLLRSFSAGPVALPAWWDQALLDERSDTVLELAQETLLHRIRTALAGTGDDDLDEDEGGADDLLDAAEPLAATYLDWLAYLIAAYRADYPAWGGTVVQVASHDHKTLSPWPGAAASREIRIDATRAELLASPDTRRVVLEALEAECGPRNEALEGVR
jgi:hypothetical protein